jgi:hypothetical protein
MLSWPSSSFHLLVYILIFSVYFIILNPTIETISFGFIKQKTKNFYIM